MSSLDILITCVVYILLAGSFIHMILEEKGKTKRKKLDIKEIRFERWSGIIPWGLSLFLNIVTTLGYYTQYLTHIRDFQNYMALSLISFLLLLIVYYLERWKVIILGEKIVVYGWLFKKTYNVSDITTIKPAVWFEAINYYIGNKKVFTEYYRQHVKHRDFVRFILENSECQFIRRIT